MGPPGTGEGWRPGLGLPGKQCNRQRTSGSPGKPCSARRRAHNLRSTLSASSWVRHTKSDQAGPRGGRRRGQQDSVGQEIQRLLRLAACQRGLGLVGAPATAPRRLISPVRRPGHREGERRRCHRPCPAASPRPKARSTRSKKSLAGGVPTRGQNSCKCNRACWWFRSSARISARRTTARASNRRTSSRSGRQCTACPRQTRAWSCLPASRLQSASTSKVSQRALPKSTTGPRSATAPSSSRAASQGRLLVNRLCRQGTLRAPVGEAACTSSSQLAQSPPTARAAATASRNRAKSTGWWRRASAASCRKAKRYNRCTSSVNTARPAPRFACSGKALR